MSISADFLVSSYHSWLKDRVTADILDSKSAELTTPFLDRHNDHLQIYAERQGPDFYLLTDDGYVIAELKSSGVEARGARREQLLNEILSGHGVTLKGSELQTAATTSELGQRLHNLIQAMLSVDDMFVLSQPTVQSLFLDDVTKFLDGRDIRYTPMAKFSGKSGLDHLVDFVIPKSTRAPERMIKLLNSPRKDRVENILFAIDDTRRGRRTDTAFYAILNDTKRQVAPEIIQAFENYEVQARPWSERDDLVDELAA